MPIKQMQRHLSIGVAGEVKQKHVVDKRPSAATEVFNDQGLNAMVDEIVQSVLAKPKKAGT